MSILSLVPSDSRQVNWLFRAPDAKGVLRIRPEFVDLKCAACGKIDEFAALQRPLPIGVRISSKRDFFEIGDGFLGVSERFRKVYDSARLAGLKFLQTHTPEHSLAVPANLVKTDESLAGFEYVLPKCASCGRYREAVVGPLVRSMEIPANPLTIFCSELWPESIMGKVLRLFASAEAATVLKRAKLKGLEIIKAH